MAKLTLPKGFQAIHGGGKFPPAWDFKKTKTLQGKIVASRKATFDKGKKDERTITIWTVKTATGEVSVYESAGLRGLLQVKKGAEIFIQYLGKKKIPGRKGQQPMNDFAVAAK